MSLEHHNLQTPELSREEEIQSIKEELSDIKEKAKEMIEEARRNYSAPIEPIKELMEKAKKLKRRLNQLESNFDLQTFTEEIKSFLIETYKKWSWSDEQQQKAIENLTNIDTLPIEDFMPKLEELKKENESETTRESNEPKIGTTIQCEAYTPDDIEEIKGKIKVINPTTEPWYEGLKTKLKRTPHLNEVFEEIHKQYPDLILGDLKTFKIIQEYIEQNDKNKQEVKDLLEVKDTRWTFYFFPGSAFVNESGGWCAPVSDWDVDDFVRNAFGLDGGWGSRYRVVLLER
jgi:vacuolar-type H+-ATPase subunit I/STV1